MRSLAFAACLVLLSTTAAHAQKAAQKIEVLEFNGTGKLLGFAAGSMAFVNAQGQQQLVKFAKPGEMSVTLKPAKGQPQGVVAGPPTVDITGQLAPEQIRPGFTVVLNCTLDAKGAAVEVKGIQLGAGGEVAANSITIKLPTPAGRAAKVPPGKTAPGKDAPAEPPKDGGQQPPKAEPKDGDAKPDGGEKHPKPGEVLPLSFRV
ncbi:MAG: hypothetical protein WD875_07225 [Pirellulales bacterium]